MSYELVGDDKPLGQFASNQGMTDLTDYVSARKFYPEMKALVVAGQTTRVEEVCRELEWITKRAPHDVASTAQTLLGLAKGKKRILITDGLA